jgi:hypothetical protein
VSDITRAHPHRTGYGSRHSLLERLTTAMVSGVALRHPRHAITASAAALAVSLFLVFALAVPRSPAGLLHTAGNGAPDQSRPRLLTFAAEPADAMTGIFGSRLVLLDLSTGEVVDSYSDASDVSAAALSPAGDLVVLKRRELAGETWRDRLEVRRIPDWSLATVLPLDSGIPPVRALAREFPAAATEPPVLQRMVIAPSGKWAAAWLTSTTGSLPGGGGSFVTWVTTLDLAAGSWANWALTLPGAQAANLLALPDKLVVMSSGISSPRQPTVATLLLVDPATGRIEARQELAPLQWTAKSARHEPPLVTYPSALPPALWGPHLVVVTEDLQGFVLDAETLAVHARYPALSESRRVGRRASVVGDRAALVGHDEVIILDLVRWSLERAYPLPQLPENLWQPVGTDLERGVLWLTATSNGCLYQLSLDQGTLSEPLRCGLAAGWPHSTEGWPVSNAETP